ncbi:gliding motility-associated-like protein [Dyadobacter jejuensis]|uniref:Gliding motility-associated-like protein n=1 Tax=Dyadobacter jejuensis TaxID=1082580 RepID=A0A316B8W0_9BACT|nr:gliding motility-associated C-terminal domain-containing protein [Dyadobacter jejuensis]PWJ58977.1 gliding motility-associated-like protein [Dyadobacter jejuensis]
MKLRFTILLLFTLIQVQASHIVGGNLFIQASKAGQYNYTLGLTMYFDALNGNAGAEDELVNIYIFRKRDNLPIAQIPVPKVSRKSITYANPICGISTLQTFMITYAIDLRLEVTAFSDPDGYYMIWDRCCRNNSITNIKNPGQAGSLFYLEFPPISKQGVAFVNSSPSFSEIKGDYACVDSPFTFDFGGTDADGDSLVYSLVTPRQGFSSSDNPSAFGQGSSNYPTITWENGISEKNIIPGPKPLTIDNKTGQLSVTASSLGLYVFQVQIDEYRKGVKIGTVTRDFQLKVVDCPKQDPPLLLFKPVGTDQFYSENEIIKLSKEDDQCFEVMVTDPSPNQIVKIRGTAFNNTNQYFQILPNSFKTTAGNDTLRFQICLDDCFISYDTRPIRLQLIAEDETCPIPLLDTLNIYIQRTDAGNNPPVVSTSLAADTVFVAAGEKTTFDVFCEDIDVDLVALSAAGQNFLIADYGMNFLPTSGKGQIQQNFEWTPPCSAKIGDVLAVDFLGEDQRCPDNTLKKIKTVYFIVGSSANTPPVVSYSESDHIIDYRLDQKTPISFQVTGTDVDTNRIVLSAIGRGFDLSSVGMQFEPQSGISVVNSQFQWQPNCQALEGDPNRSFIIDFVVADQSCAAALDTISMTINLENAPEQPFPEMPNVITPNNDGKNDCLVLSDLPTDNCAQQFIDLTIFNRWGKKVYYSKTTDDWCPENISAGYYYYVIRYTHKNIKSGLTILQ